MILYIWNFYYYNNFYLLLKNIKLLKNIDYKYKKIYNSKY